MESTTIISPRTMRETARGITLTSIYDEMLSRRELSVTGDVNSAMAFDVCQQLLQLEHEDSSAEITLYVSTPGGDVSAGLAIVDTMWTISCPVRTVCLDMAASMGAIIFVSGDRREMFPNAELMIHDPLIQNVSGSALSVQETSRRLMRRRSTLSQILVDHSNLPIERVEELTSKDTYLTAEEALEKGFTDAIVEPRKVA